MVIDPTFRTPIRLLLGNIEIVRDPKALLGFAAIEDVLVLHAVLLISRASLRRVCSAQQTVPLSKTAIWHIRDKTRSVLPSEQLPGFVGVGYEN
jgi:hypothetical protein